MRSANAIIFASFMTGCATVPSVTTAPFPHGLAQDCTYPTIKIETNRDLANNMITLRDALNQCNADKAAIRRWLESTKQ
jgi:hypothetical protein